MKRKKLQREVNKTTITIKYNKMILKLMNKKIIKTRTLRNMRVTR